LNDDRVSREREHKKVYLRSKKRRCEQSVQVWNRHLALILILLTPLVYLCQIYFTVLEEAPVSAKYSDSGSRYQGISGQVIRGVFKAC